LINSAEETGSAVGKIDRALDGRGAEGLRGSHAGERRRKGAKHEANAGNSELDVGVLFPLSSFVGSGSPEMVFVVSRPGARQARRASFPLVVSRL
jgi:hypothetical protein